jgi:MFS family permease
MRDLLHDRRFRLVFVGQATSMLGDSVMLIVLAIWVKDLTGSSGLAGAVMLAVIAPSLLSPLLGWGIDRLRRRPVLVWTNLASAAALVPLFAVQGRGQVWIVYFVALLYGVSFSVNSAGLAGLLKYVVASERLAEANAVLRTVREGLRLVGPLAGAGLYAVAGARTVVVVDLVSFLAAAATLISITVREDPAPTVELSWLREAGAGFRHLFADLDLRRTTLAVAGALLVFGSLESAIFAYVDHGLHRPATFVGILEAGMGAGSIAGALLAPGLIRRFGEPLTVAAGLAAMALGTGPLVYPNTAMALSVLPVLGLGVSFLVVAFATLLQRRTPQHLMGRVSAATDLLVGVPQTIAIAAGAVLVSRIDYRWIFAVTALGLLTAAGTLSTCTAKRPPPTDGYPEGHSVIPAPTPACADPNDNPAIVHGQ